MSEPLVKNVYTVVDSAGSKPRWVRIGRGFVNRDGSITVHLDALPLNGNLQIRDAQPEPTTGDGGWG